MPSQQQATSDSLLPGSSVHARGLPWEVVYSETAGEQTRVRLRCTAADLRGWEIDLLTPFEKIDPMVAPLAPKKAGGLREWRLYHEAFLLEQALGPSALLAVQPGRLNIAPYQLVPVMRALSMTRPRLLLADGVGLGKTVEAGLIIAELIARRRAHRVLIVSPAGPLLQQWQDEMRLRFGLRFDTFRDWGSLQEKRREIVLGANPFEHVGLCLLSMDFAKQEKVLQDLERAAWDLVIIDEAHHCFKLSGTGDNEDSRRRRLGEVLARQTDGLLLLTATPHDGYDPHFASLLDLLDPSLLDGRGALRGDQYQRHVVRRLKSHIKDPKTGAPLFKTRVVRPLAVNFGPDSHPRFAALQSALIAVLAPRLKAAVRQRQYGEVLAFLSLLKRSVSTVRACLNTLNVVAERYRDLLTTGNEKDEERKQRARSLAEYRRRLGQFGTLSAEEESDLALLEAEDMASQLRDPSSEDLSALLSRLTRDLRNESVRSKRRERSQDATLRGLEDLIELAQGALTEDPKTASIVDQVKAIRGKEPRANVLVYSEFADSADAVLEALEGAIKAGGLTGEVLSIQGDDGDRKSRQDATDRFRAEDDLVLVSTDASAEGLNLHDRCHHLIHLELPYNPSRLEQRNGRIDRYGQQHDPQVAYLYLAGTFEERVLLRLIAKFERQRQRLTFMPDTLGLTLRDGDEALTGRLLQGLTDEEGLLFKREPSSALVFESPSEDVTQPAYQELLAEIDHAFGKFEKATKTQAWLGDAGLNAEPSKIAEAERAFNQGQSLGGFDLVRLVKEAVRAEVRASDAVTEEPGGVLRLRLPQEWSRDHHGIPGWDEGEKVLRVTTDPNLFRDAKGRSLAFLGRAHPVVRRALDRVRLIPLSGGEGFLDRRVTAVQGEGPALLFSFICTVRSEAGREYERVIAVRATRDGKPEAMAEPERWMGSAEQGRAVPVAGLWEKHFESWGLVREQPCRDLAATAFEALAGAFLASHQEELAAERTELDRWLDQRATEICGEKASQLDLLAAAKAPAWQTTADPKARLAAFSTDSQQPSAQRHEAAGVVSLYEARRSRIDRRAKTTTATPHTLGLLMIVPEVRA